MIDLFTADELDQLAERIARIRPMTRTNPDAFYEERSEVARQIRALASRLRNRDETPPAAADVPAPVGRQITRRHQVVDLVGRSVLVLTTKSVPTSDLEAAQMRGRLRRQQGPLW